MNHFSVINTHTVPITFSPGAWVGRAAEELADLVATTGVSQKAEFNGTPMIGKPGDLARHILERWDYERRIYQLERRISA